MQERVEKEEHMIELEKQSINLDFLRELKDNYTK
jgi:hypothetical protein